MPFIRTKSQVNLFYNVIGTGEKTLVLVHGAGATCRMWSLQVRPLVLAGYRVVVYDSRGHGATAGTDGLYSIELFANDLKELLDALGIEEPVCLCGLSMGGLIAQRFALSNPARVKALILSNTYSFLDYPYLAAALGVDEETLRRTHITTRYIYDVFSRARDQGFDLAGHMLQASDLLLAAELDRNLFFDDQVYIQSQEDRIKTQAATGAFDSRHELDQIRCPTLVIGSEHDMIVPLSQAVYLHAHIAGSEYVLMEGSNHVPSLDNCEKFNQAILQFLGRV